MIAWRETEGVWELQLAAPPLNEIGLEVLAQLEAFLDALASEQPRAVIVHSTLERGFCAGADLRGLYTAIAGREPDAYLPELRVFLDRIHAVMNRLDALPCATVGALHGACFGGGFELALTLDVLVADKTTRFAFPELRLGIIPGFGGIPRLVQRLPVGVANDLILSGRSINARRAYELGLVSQLVAPGEALAVAREVAKQAARFDRDAQAHAKRLLRTIPYEALEREKESFLALFARPLVIDALRRFTESTDPMPYLPQGLEERA